MKLSENFTLEELTNSSDHPELVEQNKSDALEFIHNGETLCFRILQVLRDHIERPISVGSGFRNPKLNKAVGSKAKHSQHMSFDAADINVKGLKSHEGRLMLLGVFWGLEMAGVLNFGQCLIERGCIHISNPRGNGRDGEIAYYDVDTGDKIIIREGS